jgi:hypothetical protein
MNVTAGESPSPPDTETLASPARPELGDQREWAYNCGGWRRFKLKSGNQMRKSILGVVVCAAVGFGAAPPTKANTVQISGLVNWGVGTPVTLFSIPGATSSFSFNLPDPISSNPTTDVTHFRYSTSGKEVTEPLVSVTVKFFMADVAGLFDVTAVIGGIIPEEDVVSLYGPDIGTSLTIDTGTFSAAAGMQMLSATGSGTVTVSEIGVGVTGVGAGAVPESSTWVMMTLGFAGLAFAGYRTSRKSAMVA